MISLHACPRCAGAILENPPDALDGPLCINCGWRRSEISPEIQAEVEAHMGGAYVQRYTRSRIGTGKPALSGWQKVKLRRDRERPGPPADTEKVNAGERGLKELVTVA